MSLKKIFPVLLFAAALTLLAVFGNRQPLVRHIPTVNHTLTIQEKAEHRVVFLGEGQCTATAVGPHAILTAVHCNEHGVTKVKFDMSMNETHLLSKTLDGRDHVIYVIDGPPLKNFVSLPDTVQVKSALSVEHIYIYGAGGGAYPPVRKDGYQINARVGDPSEIDEREGLEYYSIPVIPGDSGSAIFGGDGRVIGVVTWSKGLLKPGYDPEENESYDRIGAGYDIAFSRAQLDAIAVGVGDVDLKESTYEPPKHEPSVFDFFKF